MKYFNNTGPDEEQMEYIRLLNNHYKEPPSTNKDSMVSS